MRKIINGARYDTDTAKKIGHWESDRDYTGLLHTEETLYRTKFAKWFLHGVGNAGSIYATRKKDSWTAPGESIVPISEDVAREWVKKRLGADEYDIIFGVASADAKDVQATVYIPAQLAEKLYIKLDELNCSRNELIIKALQEYLK